MTQVSKKFIDSYLNNKLLEAIKPLNEIKDAVDPTEQGLIQEIDGIIKKIISVEI
jgi:hypothetical protein